MSKYRIVRMRFAAPSSTKNLPKHLTLEEARAHCRQEDTHGDGWFDGYEEE